MMHTSLKGRLRPGVLYAGLALLLIACLLLWFIKGSPVVSVMDAGGWAFFVCSCLSHAATLVLVAFCLLYLPPALVGHPKVGGWLMATGVGIVAMLLILDMQVYDIYKFHINGLVLNMFFGSSSADIFTFDSQLYLKETAFLLLFLLAAYGLWLAALRWQSCYTRRQAVAVFLVAIGCTLFAHGYHVYASFMQQPSVMKSRRLLPYYFPTTAYSLLNDLGVKPPVDNLVQGMPSTSGDVVYPLQPMAARPTACAPTS